MKNANDYINEIRNRIYCKNSNVSDDIIKEIFKNDIYDVSSLRNSYERYFNNCTLKNDNVYKDIAEYLKTRYTDSTSIRETVYRIFFNIEKRPKCKLCNNDVEFIGKRNIGFRHFCSNKCKFEFNLNNNFIQNTNAKVKFKEENMFYELIKKIFPDVINQYKDTNKQRYGKYCNDKKIGIYWKPFTCDYYIPSVDMFVEYNGYYTHGKHPYRNNDEDIEYLTDYINRKHVPWMKEKWTIIDVEKRKIAKDNNLNFLELWPNDRTKTRKSILTHYLIEIRNNPTLIKNYINSMSLFETIYNDNVYLG